MRYALLVVLLFGLSGCTDWIFRIDVPQGNFLEQRSVNELHVGMTKEQVVFVLGLPVVRDSFDHDTWYYVYDLKRGMRKRGEDIRQDVFIYFEDDKVARIDGDFDIPDSFYEPIE